MKKNAPTWSRLLLLALLSTPLLGRAEPWREIVPGTSSAGDVVQQFGEPSKTIALKDKQILAYFGTRAIKGTSQVHFRFNVEGKIVDRIDVTPTGVLSVAAMESTYGAVCVADSPPAPGKSCYAQKLSSDMRMYLAYEQRGLAVLLNNDGKTVYRIVHTAAREETSSSSAPTVASASGTTSTSTTPAALEPERTGFGTFETLTANEKTVEEPLKIGGQIYIRGESRVAQDPALTSQFAAPSLIDVYLDGRPNDHLRGMLLARVVYDPTFLGSGTSLAIPGTGDLRLQLDQFWVKFDILDRVYLTAGKQHVKWGASKYWSPVDFLAPRRADLLETFDTRVGTDMLKADIPLPALAANLYLVGLFDNLGPAGKPIQFGGAARAEVVLGGVDLAVSAIIRQGDKPRFGVDASSALGPVDVYGEFSWERGSDPVWTLVGSPDPLAGYPGRFTLSTAPDYVLRGTGGIFFTQNLTDVDQLTVGGEAFVNSTGYRSVELVPWLRSQAAFAPSHAAWLYAAAYARYDFQSILHGRSASLTALSNLGDGSFLARMDLRFQVLTDMSVEFFAAVPLGVAGGEFRSIPMAAEDGRPLADPAAFIVPVVQLGVGMSFKI